MSSIVFSVTWNRAPDCLVSFWLAAPAAIASATAIDAANVYAFMMPSSLPGKNQEVLVREEIDLLDLRQTGCFHPAGDLGFRDKQVGLVLVRTLIAFVIDHDESPIGLKVTGSALQIARSIFNVMQHVVHESQIDVLRRQLRIGELTEHRFHIR